MKLNYNWLIFMGYFFSGLARGILVADFSTELIKMFSEHGSNFVVGGNILALLGVGLEIGSTLSCFTCTYFVLRFGRRKTLLIGSLTCIIGNILNCFPGHWIYLAASRIIEGVGSTLSNTTTPMLFSEFLQPHLRGIFATLMNLFITSGILISYLICLPLITHRHLFYLPSVVCIIFNIGSIIVAFISSESSAQHKVTTIASKESIYQKKYKTCFWVSLGLGLNPICGINPINVYSTLIYKNAFNSIYSPVHGAIMFASMSTFNAIVTLPTVKMFNRKTLLKIGVVLLLITQFAFFINEVTGNEENLTSLTIISFVYLFGFHLSFGNIYYPILSEIFPLEVKAEFMNFASILNWTSMCLITYVYPLIERWMSYLLFFGFTLLCFVILLIHMPETRNKTLEQIESEMIDERYNKTAIRLDELVEEVERETKNNEDSDYLT